MDLETVAKTAQKCIQNNPLIVLGSGYSLSNGVRGTSELSDYLWETVVTENEEEGDAWLALKMALNAGAGLEESLAENGMPPSLIAKMVQRTWEFVAGDDLAVLARAAAGKVHFPLTDLLQVLMRSTHKTINIVTPNYDRLAEYATDLAGLIHTTGFTPGIIRRMEGRDKLKILRGEILARTVQIWKVHGSLDWFQDTNKNILSLPVGTSLPTGISPAIIRPGASIFERADDEPFRTAIHGADRALSTASAFLCVGYNFGNGHIQPKLMERCKQRKVPIVVLAETLSFDAREFLKNHAGNDYMALEAAGDNTMVYSPGNPDGAIVANRSLWDLGGFNAIAI